MPQEAMDIQSSRQLVHANDVSDIVDSEDLSFSGTRKVHSRVCPVAIYKPVYHKVAVEIRTDNGVVVVDSIRDSNDCAGVSESSVLILYRGIQLRERVGCEQQERCDE